MKGEKSLFFEGENTRSKGVDEMGSKIEMGKKFSSSELHNLLQDFICSFHVAFIGNAFFLSSHKFSFSGIAFNGRKAL